MTYKIYIVFFFFLFLTADVFSQTKKEIISSLLEQVDSLNQVAKIDQEIHKSEIIKQLGKIDSIKSVLTADLVELRNIRTNLSQSELELSALNNRIITQSGSFDFMKNDYKKLKQSVDSLEILLAQLLPENFKKVSVEPEMVFVEGGTFQMGSTSGESKEQPVHSVTLSSFYIGKYEVTQAQWKAVMGSNPSRFQGCDQCPVESVSWNDIQDFIQKLNAQTGMNYRLPTEAEWEYAAKGGKQSRGYIYSGSNDLDSVAWYGQNSESKTHPVGGKHANELGIYDMSGNVWEWCFDWYGEYSSYNETNPWGAYASSYRLHRGGGWSYEANYCRNAYRSSMSPNNGGFSYWGFRLVLPAVR